MKTASCIITLLSLAAALVAVCGPAAARACPFCSAGSLTFAQDIAKSEAAVFARLVEPPPASALGPGAGSPLPKGKFEAVEPPKLV